MTATKKICAGLENKMPESIAYIDCSPNHIEFMRTDMMKRLKRMRISTEYFRSYLNYDEPSDTAEGRVEVLFHQTKDVKEGLEKLGCEIKGVDKYQSMWISTIHVRCPDVSKKINELIKLLTE